MHVLSEDRQQLKKKRPPCWCRVGGMSSAPNLAVNYSKLNIYTLLNHPEVLLAAILG